MTPTGGTIQVTSSSDHKSIRPLGTVPNTAGYSGLRLSAAFASLRMQPTEGLTAAGQMSEAGTDSWLGMGGWESQREVWSLAKDLGWTCSCPQGTHLLTFTCRDRYQ